ncbi:trypsin [Mycolicibacterium aromaticivorans JS19b1 = JCM 16368]|uniref:Trypsin n=2 Tax=Mycolicibacterium aromaticivorans TaxID=318425 RepID=A0A064CF82_9MYCO|nr:trypsin [Mycolicibacterium aromaticivorans JS19b1 = JCM 16368]
MGVRWRFACLASVALSAAVGLASPAMAAPPPTPGIEVDDESGRCTAGFAAQDNDGNNYLLTSGHCDAHDGSAWTYGEDDTLLGTISASEVNGDKRDAAIIRLDPGVGPPNGDVGGRYLVRDVLGASQIRAGMPFCKVGAVTGETCGEVKGVEGDVVEASVYSLEGDSGSPGFVKNPDGTVSAVGILMSSPDGDDYTTYFTLVQPLLAQWGLRILP